PTWSAPSISIARHVVSITLDGGADRGNPRSPTRPPCCAYCPCSQACEPVSSGAEPVGLARHSPAPAAWAPVRAGHASAHLMNSEERMAVFLDYENLALGARDHLGGTDFDYGPIADALAVRGRTVMRRAYADWSFFDEDRRALTRHQVELIEMPQRMGVARK